MLLCCVSIPVRYKMFTSLTLQQPPFTHLLPLGELPPPPPHQDNPFPAGMVWGMVYAYICVCGSVCECRKPVEVKDSTYINLHTARRILNFEEGGQWTRVRVCVCVCDCFFSSETYYSNERRTGETALLFTVLLVSPSVTDVLLLYRCCELVLVFQ